MKSSLIAIFIPQVLIGLIVSALLLVVSLGAGFSCTIGALVILVLNGYVLLRQFLSSQRNGPQMLTAFYQAELGKLLLLALIVFVLIKTVTLVWWAFLLGLLVTQLSLLFSLLWQRRAI